MNARLFCKTGQLAGANYTISDEATIGKGPDNTIQLYPSVVSTRHARISFDKKSNAFFIEDFRSRNGTRVDGMRVVGKEKLDRLHVITIAGQFDFIFQMNTGEVQAATTAPSKKVQPVAQPSPKQSPAKGIARDQKTVVDTGFEMMPKLRESPKPAPVNPANKTVIGDDFVQLPAMVPAATAKTRMAPPPKPASQDVGKKTVIGDDSLPMPGIASAKPPAQVPNADEGESAIAAEFHIEFMDLPGGRKSFSLKEGENTVGRESGCDIRIEDGSLSRKHAALTVRGGTVLIKDLGSKNYTFLENQKLNYEVEIRSGANLMFGMVKAILVKK